MKLRIFIFIIILVLIGTVIFLFNKEFSYLQGKEFDEGENAPEVILISVYDNYKVNPELETAWGFGCVVKISKELLLFDTGGNSKILLSNMKKMHIHPKSINKLIISHIHGDHVGGLKGFLEVNNNVTVFIPSSFPSSVRNMITNKGAKFFCVDKPRKISEFVYTTGELYGPPKEQSLIINSKLGLIVITGCAHPGVINIVKKAKEMFPKENVYLVLGGFHLFGASDSKLKSIISDFRKLGVGKIASSHCSGDRCRELFKEEYKEDFIEFGVGGIIEVKEIKPERQVIETEAEGEIIHYFQESFYSKDDFFIILKDRDRFESNLIQNLKKKLIGVSEENFEFIVDRVKKSVILKCDVKGASYGTNSYDMHFLLGSWPFDLYQFKKYEKKLVYAGKINGTSTKVVFKFPYSLSHCHEHIWSK
ncbi:hypothetical protein BXT86_03620 [candidate division WOR-3 bacterium 4484_100]|uniref:Metallo-beta-lactamase domain-containing protein n=1 Tax=candidate division WOR-3 bacterium 4484_100 TaxID=1936077 RepID=A0A1V4QF45_UNCW3|nr:MAG: hypothetical protein BXT86_03620 [candidate division WOR-3 bacterium 4484_100]